MRPFDLVPRLAVAFAIALILMVLSSPVLAQTLDARVVDEARVMSDAQLEEA